MFGQPEQRDQLIGLATVGGVIGAKTVAQPHVLSDGEPVEQQRLLAGDAGAKAVAFVGDQTRVGAQVVGEQVEHGRLAGSAGAEQGELFAVVDLDREPVQDATRPVTGVDSLESSKESSHVR